MEHFLLKFNHGVEIGARLAYVGHARRIKDPKVWSISRDELAHKDILRRFLYLLDQEPNPVIDGAFRLIGGFIRWQCRYAPLWSLDLVARAMEIFAVVSYNKLSKIYPAWRHTLEYMAKTEDMHMSYFTGRIARDKMSKTLKD